MAFMLVNEECLSSVCELGTSCPQPFVSPLSFKTTHILAWLYCTVTHRDAVSYYATKAVFPNSLTMRKKIKQYLV